MPFKVAITPGLYGIARGEELADVVRKFGFGMTRGTDAIEIPADVPHEVDYTSGRQLRYVAEKSGIEVLWHGSLTVPMCIGEVERYREAEDHLKKSIRSAVFGGCKYVNFHSCLHPWPELATFSEMRWRAIMVDERGRLIKELLKENEKLRKWFVEELGKEYVSAILTNAESYSIRDYVDRKIAEEFKESATTQERGARYIELYENEINKKIEERLKKGERWDNYELGSWVDAFRIVANNMFLEKDQIFVEMAKIYPKIKVKWGDKKWIDGELEKAKETGDIKFKEFYYAVAGAKFLEGHMKNMIDFLDKGLPQEIRKMSIDEVEKRKLMQIAKDFRITIEVPDARDPGHAGLYTLWRPKQIITAIKIIQKKFKTDRVWALIDFEHIATQGVDPVFELKELTKLIPDAGHYIISIHATHPTPYHTHKTIELGEMTIYNLLWTLRKAGLGKKRLVYLVFERGGGDDPFKRSVIALKLMAKFLDKDVPPKELPPEYFGVEAGGPAFKRQEVTIKEHFLDPLKGMLTVPEEEYTFLSTVAKEKGKVEEWKKEKLR